MQKHPIAAVVQPASCSSSSNRTTENTRTLLHYTHWLNWIILKYTCTLVYCINTFNHFVYFSFIIIWLKLIYIFLLLIYFLHFFFIHFPLIFIYFCTELLQYSYICICVVFLWIWFNTIYIFCNYVWMNWKIHFIFFVFHAKNVKNKNITNELCSGGYILKNLFPCDKD